MYLYFEHETVWQELVHFRVDYCANLVNMGQRKDLIWRNVIDFWTFLVWWCPVFGTWLNLIFSNKLLFDSWCSISESVNHVSDHDCKCFILGSAISNGKSECVMKFRFASMFMCLKFAGVACSSLPILSLDFYFLQKTFSALVVCKRSLPSWLVLFWPQWRW